MNAVTAAPEEGSTQDRELVTSRLLAAPRALIFRAFREPAHLAAWWGPAGFRNTFHAFEFKTGGAWKFTMHGPDGQDYPNESVFAEIQEPERIVIDHICPPRFVMHVTLTEEEAGRTRIHWRMIFETAELCGALKAVCIPANEQNFDRLEAELVRMKN